MTRMLIFFIWILCTTSVSGMELQRLNYGVVFEKEAKLQIDAEMWIHTFEIQLPEVTNLIKLKGCTSSNKICDLVRDVMLEINKIKQETESMINNTIETISDLIPERNLLVKSRSHHAMLPFIDGDLSKTIFGTDKDVETLARHIYKLNKMSREVVKSVERDENDTASYIQTADKRMTNLMEGIKENEVSIDNLQQLLHRSIYNIEKSFSAVSVLIAKEVQKSRQLESVFGTLLKGIYDLVEGKLSPCLISQRTMEKTVHDIKGILNSKFNGFHMIYQNPQDIYENVETIYVRQGSKLFISVKFPMTHFSEPLTVYKIQSFPVPINSTSNHATQLLDLPDYLAITNDMSYYTAFQTHEISECISNKLMVCKFGMVLTPHLKKSCALALFQDDKLLVKSHCDFRFLLNQLESRMISLSMGSLLVYNTDVLEFNCKSGRQEVQGCKFCIIRVPCECSVSTVDMYLPPRLTKCHKNTTTKLYPVNLALLQSFFNNSSLETVESSTLFKNIPLVDVPQFKLYYPPMSNIIANDRQSHLSLHKMAQSAKKDAMIFQSLTEPLLSGDISLEDSWPRTNDIILYVTEAVAGISLLGFIFTAIKLRKVMIMLAVLQYASVKQVHATAVPSIVYKKPEYAPAPSTYVLENVNIELEHVIVGLELCIILLIVILFVYMCKFRRDKTQIVCEITNGESCVHISLKELSLCPTYWKITVPQKITNISIQGFLAPILTFKWDKLEVNNTLTEQTVILQTQFRVNLLYARKLRNIMVTPYFVYFYVQHKRLLIPLK